MNLDSGFGINIPNPVNSLKNATLGKYYYVLNALITEDSYISAIEFYMSIPGIIWIFVRRYYKLTLPKYFVFHLSLFKI